MKIDPGAIVYRLQNFPSALRALVAVASPGDASWKPAPQHWSILEVCAHLADEETEDFRPRLKATLAKEPWPPLDLDNIANRRGYNQMDLAEVLNRLERERAASINWLQSLLNGPPIDWSTAHQHPKFGPITAGDLLASWAAHDALHLRQIAKRLHNLAARDGAEHKIAYAGEWTA